MTTATPVTISDARQFSLSHIQRNALIETDDLEVVLLCFEAGQRDDERSHAGTCLYQVLEGEALVRQGEHSQRLGKNKLLAMPADTPHLLENAGGGLLVVMATRAR